MNHIDLEKAQLGLGNSYNRANVKFNVNRVDNMVIHAISLLDTLDKEINTFCMRVRYCKFKLSIVFTFFGVLYETTFKIVQSGSILTAVKLRSISHKCHLILYLGLMSYKLNQCYGTKWVTNHELVPITFTTNT